MLARVCKARCEGEYLEVISPEMQRSDTVHQEPFHEW